MVSNKPFEEQPGSQSQQQRAGGRFAENVQQSGGRLGERLRETGQNIAREQKNRVCEELESVSEVVHEAADRLHERDDDVVADYVDALADQLEKAADYVRDHTIGDLLDSVNDFARRRPELLIGGALVAGLAAARFLKASRQRQSQERFSASSQTHGGSETRTSEAGPIATSPRISPHTPGSASAMGGTGGQGEESLGITGGSGREQFSGRISDRPQGHERSERPRAVSEDDARQGGRGLEGIHGSRMAAEGEDIGGDTPHRDRESQQPQRSEDKP